MSVSDRVENVNATLHRYAAEIFSSSKNAAIMTGDFLCKNGESLKEFGPLIKTKLQDFALLFSEEHYIIFLVFFLFFLVIVHVNLGSDDREKQSVKNRKRKTPDQFFPEMGEVSVGKRGRVRLQKEVGLSRSISKTGKRASNPFKVKSYEMQLMSMKKKLERLENKYSELKKYSEELEQGVAYSMDTEMNLITLREIKEICDSDRLRAAAKVSNISNLLLNVMGDMN